MFGILQRFKNFVDELSLIVQDSQKLSVLYDDFGCLFTGLYTRWNSNLCIMWTSIWYFVYFYKFPHEEMNHTADE